MTLESNKTLGGIGAILMLIGVLPFISYYLVVEIIGAILVLVALYGLGRYYNQMGIFNNAIYGVGVAIVGAVITAAALFFAVWSSVVDLLKQIYPGWNGDLSTLQGMTPNTTNFDPTTLYPLVLSALAVLIIVWIFAIVTTFFIWRSLRQTSEKTNVGLFGTAGLILFIGAIIPIFGLILMWISTLLLAIAFFSIKTQTAPPPMATTTTPPAPTTV